MPFLSRPDRRRFLGTAGTLLASALLPRPAGAVSTRAPLVRAIASSGERIPAIGLGTWITFDVGSDPAARAARRAVLQAFFARGGTVIDSSPMYGAAEEVLGELLPQVRRRGLFAATKVWTGGRQAGIRQMDVSRRLWGVERFDLMQIHNMVDWRTHLETLQAWKGEGRIRYLGITTSHGRRHDEMEQALRQAPFDFVQLTYNLAEREAERRLLPLAAERGIAVIANRPFDGGGLFRRVRGHALPAWAAEIDCRNWAQIFLKFIVSHPAVTCAIPATSQVGHLEENMGALHGRLPDARLRAQMVEHFLAL